MSEFLHYQIFGLMSVQTYLIIAACFLLFMGLVGKNTAFRAICKSLVWPWPALLMVFVLLGSLVVGLIAVFQQVFKGRCK